MASDTIIEECSHKYYQLREEDCDYVKNKINTLPRFCNSVLSVSSCLLIVLLSAATCVSLYRIWHGSNYILAYSFSMKYNVYKDLTKNITTEPIPAKVISCYYNFPSEHGAGELLPSDINPTLCTHINVAFAQVVSNMIKLEEHQYKTLLEIVKLKHINPDLKILLSVGGANNDHGFPDMVSNHKSRKVFIKSIKSILRNYTLDGIDLDWEFPALHNAQAGGRERQHFSQLLREIRMEYIREKRNYILTVAAAAPQTIVDISYDVDQLNEYLDFVNIMTYDFHDYTKYTPFTGLNSPLYARSTEGLYLATLNINYTVHLYLNKGLDRNKIVVGIPTYGHTFSLVNANNHQINSPASGFGSLGSLGFVNYPDVCSFVTNMSDVHIMEDKEAKVPYLYRNKEWVSYEGPQSVMEKAKYIIENQLRGAMIYSLNADDYRGECRGELAGASAAGFPLSVTVSKALKNCTASDGY